MSQAAAIGEVVKAIEVFIEAKINVRDTGNGRVEAARVELERALETMTKSNLNGAT